MKHFAPFIACLLSLSIAAADQHHGGSWKDVRVTNMVTYTAEGYPPKGLGDRYTFCEWHGHSVLRQRLSEKPRY
jgi:hypothetical protein